MRPTKKKLSRSKGAPAASLRYKVVELSIVDEISLERALNQWISMGWRLDGIQFAMRDSSRRPAMAFLLFTRPDHQVAEEKSTAERLRPRGVGNVEHVSADPWRRLRELAGFQAEDDEPADPTSE